MGVLAIDEHLIIRYCNGAAARLLDRPAGELLEAPITAVVPPERHDLAHRYLERTLAQGEHSEFEFRHRPAGRPPVHLAVSVSPIIAEGGAVRGASIWLRDITRQVDLLRNIAQAQKMAALESMAGAVAHHFNNLLGGIVTAISFAETSDHPDGARRALRTTSHALARLESLMSSLLAFAEGDHTTTVQANLTEVVQRHMQNLAPALSQHSINLEANIQHVDLLLPAKCAITFLGCLTANAIEAMPDGGTLRIELRSTPTGGASLTIGDTGPGIREEDLARVFEPFFTTKSSDRTRPSDHPGLGLAMVHGIVCDLGGTATVENGPAGVICRILLPATPSKPRP